MGGRPQEAPHQKSGSNGAREGFPRPPGEPSVVGAGKPLRVQEPQASGRACARGRAGDARQAGWCDRSGRWQQAGSAAGELGPHGLQEVWCLLKSNKNVYECVLFLFLEIASKV